MSLTDVNLFRIDGNIGFTSNLQTSALNGGPLAGTRNRIINGDMQIDQRNAGASTSLSDATYYLDRYRGVATQGSKANVVQSSTAPAGFSNSLLVTSSSAYSITSSDIFAIQQRIEGFNFSDFGWGAAGAASITLSFWVRSSLTGTFGGALLNSAQNRSYPFTFSISAANTFELKSITIAGDTSGTWIGATNGIGAIVCFGLGAGATYSGTAGAWSGSAFYSATGATSVVGTNGATFYITGVQLEPGSTATPFERRSYGQELALCQRYYQKSYRPSVAPGTSTFDGMEWINGATARIALTTRHTVQMRSTTTIVPYDSAGTANRVRTSVGDGQTGYVVRGTTENNFTVDYTSGGINEMIYHWTASAEL
jgi:hypothetical protein